MAAAEFDNAAIVRRYWDVVWNRGDLSAIDDLVDDNFTNFGVRQPGAHAVVRHIVTAWRTAFPDLNYEIRQEIVQGDKVVHQVVLRGTHLGEFQLAAGPSSLLGTLPPTGRSIETDQIHIHRVEDGRIVEHTASRNDLLMVTQLGLAPTPQPAT
jgi:predicted ester cyclase